MTEPKPGYDADTLASLMDYIQHRMSAGDWQEVGHRLVQLQEENEALRRVAAADQAYIQSLQESIERRRKKYKLPSYEPLNKPIGKAEKPFWDYINARKAARAAGYLE